MMKVNLSRLPAPLKATLKTADGWLRLQEAVRLLLPGVSLGLLVTLGLIWLGRLYPLTFPVILLAIGLSLTFSGLLGLWLYLWFRPHSPLAIARLLDRRLQLEERLSTGVELAATGAPHTSPLIVQAQLADTVRHLDKFDPVQIFPLRLSGRWGVVTGLLLAAIAVSLLLPNPQVYILQRRAQSQEILAEQVTRLEAIRAELLADEALLQTQEGEVLEQTLDELIQALQEGQLSPEEALAELAEAEQNLARLEEANQQEATLNDLAQTFSQFNSTERLAEAIRERDFAEAAEAIASLGDQLSANPQAGQELAEALQQAAQAAEQAGDTELAESLRQAAESLEQALAEGGDPQQLQEALEQAAQALSEAGQDLAGQDAVRQALANIQEARRQLAEANGQNPAQGQEQQLGQGQGQGQDQGQGGGRTGGAGREDSGPGAEGLFAEEEAPDAMATDNGPNEGRTEEYQPIYAPLHLGGEGGPLVNPEPQGAEEGVPVGTAPVDPNRDPNNAVVPYNQVYGQYNEAASRALDDSYIPLGMKSYIRNYFGALEPE